MAYIAKNFECPDQTKTGFLPGTSRDAERLVLTVFRTAWLSNDLRRPYIALAAYTEAVDAGWLTVVRSPSTVRLTDKALDALYKVYGR